jgi:hypothetical protein
VEIAIKKLIKNPKGRILESNNEKVSMFTLRIQSLKRFASVPWHISWYRNRESKKAFPILIQEMTDLNPDFKNYKRFFPGFNPFFKHLEYLQYYLAFCDGKIAGRVASFIDWNYKEKVFSGRVGAVGLFEAENIEIGNRLLEEAITDLKKEGVGKIVGPMRFNASGEVGLLIDGFDVSPMPMEPYNPPYYKDVFDKFGQKENDWFSFLVDKNTPEEYMNKINGFEVDGNKLEERFKKEHIVFRNAEMAHFQREIDLIRDVYNATWDSIEHPQFEKFNEDEFKYIASTIKTVAIEDLIFLVEEHVSTGSSVLGISVTIPNINEVVNEVDKEIYSNFAPSNNPFSLRDFKRDLVIFGRLKDRLRSKRFNSARIFILGTVKKKIGLDAVLYKRTFDNCERLGMRYASASQIADINLNMINPLLKMGKVGFTWRVYRLL